MTVAFKLPPMVGRLAADPGLDADLQVMEPFFVEENGYTGLYGVDTAHIHFQYNPDKEAMRRFDIPEARTRVASVVPLTEVDHERAVAWWFRPDGEVRPWLFAAEEEYTAPAWRQDLAKIGAFFADNGLTNHGVRSLRRPWVVGKNEMEVEFTDPRARIQVFSVVPRSLSDDPTWDGQKSLWQLTSEGPSCVLECFKYKD